MATRRLKSDRFFTIDYCPEVYTQTGLDWIDRTTLATILQRHYLNSAESWVRSRIPSRPGPGNDQVLSVSWCLRVLVKLSAVSGIYTLSKIKSKKYPQ